MDAIYYIQPSKEKYDLFLKMHSLHNHHVFDFVTKRENCVLTLYMILNVLFELTVKIWVCSVVMFLSDMSGREPLYRKYGQDLILHKI